MEEPTTWQVVTDRQPTSDEMAALAFAWKAVKHVKSNAIVVSNRYQTLGIGAGQMNRVGSVKLAIEQAGEYAAKHGIKAIIQPGGSIKDQASIDMANKHGIAMVFTNVRHFRH